MIIKVKFLTKEYSFIKFANTQNILFITLIDCFVIEIKIDNI